MNASKGGLAPVTEEGEDLNNQNVIGADLDGQAPVPPPMDDMGCNLAAVDTQEGMEGKK